MTPGACCDHCDGSLQGLFEAALRRPHSMKTASHVGQAADEGERLQVVMGLEVRNGAVAEADYKATTCATLLAYCELLTRMVKGRTVAEAARVRAENLIERVRGVPPYRHSRAALAVRALQAALSENEKGADSQ